MHLSKSGVSIYPFPIFFCFCCLSSGSISCIFILNLFACVLKLLIKHVSSLLSQYMINVHYISRHMGTWNLLIKLCFLEHMIFDHGEMRTGVSKSWQHFKYLIQVFTVFKKLIYSDFGSVFCMCNYWCRYQHTKYHKRKFYYCYQICQWNVVHYLK